MRFITLVFVLIFFAAAPEARAAKGEPIITIAADVWCPINCAPGSDKPGVGIELAKRVFEPQGYSVRYIVLPWGRALEKAEKGEVDAVVGVNHRESDTLIFPRRSVFAISDDIYVRADDPLHFESAGSLDGRRVGIVHDYGYKPELSVYLENRKSEPGAVQEVSGENALQQNIRKLIAGRIDALVDNRTVVEETLQEMGLQGRLRLAGSFQPQNVYLAFSSHLSRSAAFAASFDRGVDALKTSGALTAIYARYGLEPP